MPAAAPRARSACPSRLIRCRAAAVRAVGREPSAGPIVALTACFGTIHGSGIPRFERIAAMDALENATSPSVATRFRAPERAKPLLLVAIDTKRGPASFASSFHIVNAAGSTSRGAAGIRAIDHRLVGPRIAKLFAAAPTNDRPMRLAFSMQPLMLQRRQQLQVLDAVVGGVAVDVVNLVAARDRTTIGA